MNKKILIDTSYFSSSGAQKICDKLIKNFKSENYYCIYKNQLIYLKNNKIIKKIRRKSSFFYKIYWYFFLLPWLIKKYNFDIYVSFNGYIPIIKFSKFKIIVSFNNMLAFEVDRLEKFIKINFFEKIKYKILKLVYLISYLRSDKIIVFGKTIKNILVKNFYKKKIETLYLGLDKNKNLKFKKNIFFYSSSYKSYKNHLFLIKAYSIVHKSNNQFPNLVFAGSYTPDDHKHLELLKNKINKYKLNKKIIIYKNINKRKISYLLNSSRFLLFPSLCESSSVAFIEKISTNNQVIASNIPINKEIGKKELPILIHTLLKV